MSLTRSSLLIDGHVHFHECFTWGAFLNAAAANFADARRKLWLAADSPGCLMLTERAGVNHFGALRDAPALGRTVGWQVEPGDDRCSIVLSRRADDTMVIIAGRQIVTAERLEVLALGSTDEFADGRPIGDVLRAVVDQGAHAVIPWGFGKWLGRRGRIVHNLLERATSVPFCLGDNGGRASILPRPWLLDHAEQRGVPVLGGSDPLPLPAEVRRAGGYGFILDDWQATPRPAEAVTRRIRELGRSPVAFGQLTSVSAMIRSQLEIRRQHRIGTLRGPAAAA